LARGWAMKMPRFRLRTLMVAVAVVAVVMGLVVRRVYCRRLAAYHELKEWAYRQRGEAAIQLSAIPPHFTQARSRYVQQHARAVRLLQEPRPDEAELSADEYRHEADLCIRWLNYHAEMKARYRLRAENPFALVAPDPPPPE
jgi:hypothetical protein